MAANRSSACSALLADAREHMHAHSPLSLTDAADGNGGTATEKSAKAQLVNAAANLPPSVDFSDTVSSITAALSLASLAPSDSADAVAPCAPCSSWQLHAPPSSTPGPALKPLPSPAESSTNKGRRKPRARWRALFTAYKYLNHWLLPIDRAMGVFAGRFAAQQHRANLISIHPRPKSVGRHRGFILEANLKSRKGAPLTVPKFEYQALRINQLLPTP
jgi:hypothetical protein